MATVATGEATDASGWRKIEGGGGKESPAGQGGAETRAGGRSRGSVDSRESSDPIGKYCGLSAKKENPVFASILQERANTGLGNLYFNGIAPTDWRAHHAKRESHKDSSLAQFVNGHRQILRVQVPWGRMGDGQHELEERGGVYGDCAGACWAGGVGVGES